MSPNGGPAKSAPVRGPRLAARLPDGAVAEYPLAAVKTTLGRHPANTIRLTDREVSKEHAAIERLGGAFVLRDLGSSNGTFVNGRRVRELRLKEGDEIALGNNCKLIFHAGDGQPTTSQSAPSGGGVTVVASAQSMPAFVAQLQLEAAREQTEFLPADQIKNPESLKQDYEKLRVAHKFHQQVGFDRDSKSLAEKILRVSFEILPAERGVLFLADEKTGELQALAVHEKKKGDGELTVSDTVLKRVSETKQAVLTKDAILDARFNASESIVAAGIRSAMAVPLISSKGALRGILFLDSRERSNAFSEKDLKILSGIATQAAIALENSELARKVEAEIVTRAELSRFLSTAVAEAVIKGDVESLRRGQQAEVSVLFADIRGFTSMAEAEDPQETVGMLNEFFTAMADVVFRHSGNLDKFIGDCVMAVWGPPRPNPDDAARVLKAALEMQAEVRALNEQRVEDGKKPIEVGIGVNTGVAIVGYMGSAERHEYTAIGDSVNVASRLCGIAKGGEVLASEFTVRRAGPGFVVQPLPVSQVKGKEKGVNTFRIVGLEDASDGSR